MSSQAETRVLRFNLWLEEIGRKRPKKVFVRIRDVKDIMTGETYEHQPWSWEERRRSGHIYPSTVDHS